MKMDNNEKIENNDNEVKVSDNSKAEEEPKAEASKAEEEPKPEASKAEEEPKAEASKAEEEPETEASEAEEEPKPEVSEAEIEPKAEASEAEEEPKVEASDAKAEEEPKAEASEAEEEPKPEASDAKAEEEPKTEAGDSKAKEETSAIKAGFIAFLQHFRIFSTMGNEIKFSVVSFFPVFLAILLPIVYPLLISLTYVKKTVVERPAVVLDLDNSAITNQLIVDMDATQGLTITRHVKSIDEGYEAVMSREVDAFIFFPEDFSTSMKRFERGNIKVYVYATNMMNYASVLTAIQTTALEKNVEIAVAGVANPKGLTGEKAIHTIDPLQYDKTILYAPKLTYGDYICPMLYTLVFHQMGLLIMAFGIGFHREKDPNKFGKKRLWLVDYLWRYLFYIPLIILGMFINYYIFSPAFGLPHGEQMEMIKLLVIMIVANFPLAAALASVCYDRYTPFQLLLATSLIFFSFSGYVWPLYSMSEWTQIISNFMVEQQVASAMRKIAFKGGSIADCGNEIVRMYELFWVNLIIALPIIHRGIFAWPFKKLWSLIRKPKAEMPAAETAA